jgi:hypothetical protein
MAVFNKEYLFFYTCNHNNHKTLIFSHPGLDRMWMFHDISQSPHYLIELGMLLEHEDAIFIHILWTSG